MWLSVLALPSHVLCNPLPLFSSFCLWLSQETWLDKTAWAIKATKSLGSRVWHAETFCKCKKYGGKKQSMLFQSNEQPHTHINDRHRQPIFLLPSDPPSLCLHLPSSPKFLFLSSPGASPSLWNCYFCLVSLGQCEPVGFLFKRAHTLVCKCKVFVPPVRDVRQQSAVTTHAARRRWLLHCCVTNTSLPTVTLMQAIVWFSRLSAVVIVMMSWKSQAFRAAKYYIGRISYNKLNA